MKLKWKITLPALLLLALGIGLVAALSYNVAAQFIKKDLTDRLLYAATDIQDRATQWMDDRISQVKQWSHTDACSKALLDSFVGKAARKQVTDEFKGYRSEYDYFSKFTLANESGTIVASSQGGLEGKTVTKDGHFTAALNGKYGISEPAVDSITKKAIASIYCPVKDPKGAVAGVLIGSVDLKRGMNKYVDSAHIGKDGYSFVFDRNGLVFAYPKNAVFLSKGLKELPFAEKLFQGDGLTEYEMNNKKRIVALASCPKFDWIVASSADFHEVTAPVRRIGWTGGITALATLLVASIIMRMIIGRIARPITTMTEAAQAIADGKLNVDLTCKSKDEIGQLSLSLQAMAEKLFLYVSCLDAVPFPVSVTDTNKNWIFINKAVSDLTGLHRAEVMGQPCSNWGSEICGSEKCGIECLHRGIKSTTFHQSSSDTDFKVDAAYMHNVKGEVIGHIETVQDISEISSVVKYNKTEIKRLAENLDRMGRGELQLNTEQTPANEHTADQFSQFKMINTSLMKVSNSVKALIADANQLADAGAEGQLAVRADENRHAGAYREVIQGMNQMMEILVTQLKKAGTVLKKVAHGEALELITEELKGDYNINKENINTCVITLNELLQETDKLVQAGLDGQLDASVNVDAYEGRWKELAQGLNAIMKAMATPLNEAAGILQYAANNDLTHNMTGEYNGHLGDLKNNMNSMTATLNRALGQVMQAISLVNSGANQITDASEALSQGATTQASSLQEITSSLEQIASQTKTNAENATQATLLANNARDAAEKGGLQMQDMVSAMNDINASSTQISKIIKVIDDIAFQTNLLALNAAVEAARAGVHGKGFAVVADEVRNLAGRSAKAAKETADLIDQSGGKVSRGLQVAVNTSSAIQEIITQIIKAADLVNEIAAASNEQAAGVAQINIGLVQVDQITQQNTANAEETAAASQELLGQARELKKQIEQFTLTESKIADASERPGKQRNNVHSSSPKYASSNDGWKSFTPSQGISDEDHVIDLDEHV